MEVLNLLAVIGFGILGMLIPEFCSAIGSDKRMVPVGQNVMSVIAFSFIAIYFIYR